MTEAEYLACTCPEAMLAYLCMTASDRPLRLFLCACCRLAWDWMKSRHSRRAVEVAERFADGWADARERQTAWNLARWAVAKAFERRDYLAAWACSLAAASVEEKLAWGVVHEIQRVVKDAPRLCQLVHDIFGNPFRSVTADPSWLYWNDGTVRKMARAIYAESGFADMPLLADALEEAGCTETYILTHCRSPIEHVHGCWVLSLLLGKA